MMGQTMTVVAEKADSALRRRILLLAVRPRRRHLELEGYGKYCLRCAASTAACGGCSPIPSTP
jgi:hypothetical protein